MYIEPNTSIYILKGVPLDPTYDHTIYWYDINAQVNYFYSKVKYTFARQTYQRVNRGYMRIQRKAEDLYDCNYLMFQNTAFGNKWFFAFITEINYVNNEVSEVRYEIDVMQTYHFDYALGQCFVEREHSETDNVGDNLIPEDIELGDYVTDDFDSSGQLSPLSIVVASPFDDTYQNAVGEIASGLYSMLKYKAFPFTIQGCIDCNTWITGAGAKAQEIVMVYICPTNLINRYTVEQGSTGSAVTLPFTKTKKVSGAIAGTYTPKNKKLYTYPYNFLYVTNLQGSYAVYPYEYFSGNDCEFFITGDMNPNMSAFLVPQNFKGTQANYDEKLTQTGWPVVPWVVDSFKAYVAMQSSNAIMGTLSGAMQGGITGGGAGLLGGALKGGLGKASDLAAQTYTQMILQKVAPTYAMPLQAHGYPASSASCAARILEFCFMHKHIREEYVKIIDDFFTRYGYACHRVKIPNRNIRPQFNYVKTVDCLIEALDTSGHGLPADDEATICGIYNKGITFWKNPANIGDYTVNNAPTNQ